MTRQIKDPYTIKKRKTFKKHSDHYKKVYAPYLPAILITFFSLSILVFTTGKSGHTLSYSTDISASRLASATNAVRVENGSNVLRLNNKLVQAAQDKADDMSKNNYWSHITPSGKQPWDFIKSAGYNYQKASENLAYGFTSTEATINGWLNSPSHKKAMLDKDVVEVGFGIANSPDYQDRGAQTIVVALYAQPQKSKQVTAVNSVGDYSQRVSFAQYVSAWNNSTTNFALGALLGGLIMFLVIKNIVRVRRTYKKTRRYVLHHPAVDAAALSLILLLVVISRSSGFIQ